MFANIQSRPTPRKYEKTGYSIRTFNEPARASGSFSAFGYLTTIFPGATRSEALSVGGGFSAFLYDANGVFNGGVQSEGAQLAGEFSSVLYLAGYDAGTKSERVSVVGAFSAFNYPQVIYPAPGRSESAKAAGAFSSFLYAS